MPYHFTNTSITHKNQSLNTENPFPQNMDISQFKNKWSFVTINSSQNKRIISQQNFQIYTITIYKIITTFFLMSENLIELGPVSSSRQTSRLKEC